MKIRSLPLTFKGLIPAFVLGLTLAKPAQACTQLLTQPDPDVYETLMFPKDDQIVGECLALIANGGANQTIETAVAISLATDIKKYAEEPARTQIETWVKKTQNLEALDYIVMGFGMDCQPSSCLLRESSFAAINTALQNKSTQKTWLNYRLTALVAKGIGFDTVLEANLASGDPYEKLLIDAFKGYSVEFFRNNVSTSNAERFKYWTNLVKASIGEKFSKLATNFGYSDLLPIMQDFIVLKSITDEAVLAAKAQKVGVLKNNRFQDHETDATWKSIINDIYPIYWKIVASLSNKAIRNDLPGMTNEQFESLFVSTLISDSQLASTATQALQALSFSRYPATVNSQRIKLYLEQWQQAVADRFCSAADSQCQKSDTDLLVIASRPDVIDARNDDLIAIKGFLASRDGTGYLSTYESLVDIMDRTDPYFCETNKSAMYTPCITLGTVLKRAVDPLLYAVNDRYAKLSTPSNPPLMLLEMINNFEFSYMLAFNPALAAEDGAFVQKFIAVATENKAIDLATSYRSQQLTLDAAGDPGLLHQAICKRVQQEPGWFPMNTDTETAYQAKIERIVHNIYALNRMVSRVVLKKEVGTLNWDNDRDRDTLNNEFFTLLGTPPLAGVCAGSELDFDAAYFNVFNTMNTFLYSPETYWDRDLTDIKNRFDN